MRPEDYFPSDEEEPVKDPALLEKLRTTDSYGAVVIESGSVLLVGGRRSTGFPKGHIEPGESPEQTAIREVLEETGIPISVDPSLSVTIPSIRPGDKRSITLFIGKSLSGLSIPRPQPGELRTAEWVPLPEAAARITFPVDRDAFAKLLAEAGITA